MVKHLFTPWKRGSIKKSKYGFRALGENCFWMIFIPVNCALESLF